MSYLAYPITFNGIDLNTVSGLTVLKTNPYHLPTRELSIADLARTSKSKINSAYYKERLILVRVGITRATRALLETSIDSLMTILQPIDKVLVLPQAGGLRKYYTTLSDAVVNEEVEGGSYIEMDLIFTCSDRFGYDINPTVLLSFPAYTSSNRSDGLTFRGSAPWQVPVITLTFSSITSGTNKAIVVGNSSTGQQVTITRTWASTDIVEIDSYNKTVKVNGVAIDYTGVIPEWEPGFGYWYYSDTFGTRTFIGSITCVFRYT